MLYKGLFSKKFNQPYLTCKKTTTATTTNSYGMFELRRILLFYVSNMGSSRSHFLQFITDASPAIM